MTTMWIDNKNPFDITFFSGSHGFDWRLEGEPQSTERPTPPKIPFVLLTEQEIEP